MSKYFKHPSQGNSEKWTNFSPVATTHSYLQTPPHPTPTPTPIFFSICLSACHEWLVHTLIQTHSCEHLVKIRHISANTWWNWHTFLWTLGENRKHFCEHWVKIRHFSVNCVKNKHISVNTGENHKPFCEHSVKISPFFLNTVIKWNISRNNGWKSDTFLGTLGENQTHFWEHWVKIRHVSVNIGSKSDTFLGTLGKNQTHVCEHCVKIKWKQVRKIGANLAVLSYMQ